MLDFFEIDTRNSKNGLTVFPKFKISGSVKDLMVQGKDFYAVWNEKTGLWSKNEFDVQRVVDEAIDEYIASNSIKNGLIPLRMSDYSSGMWKKYKDYIKNLPTNSKQLDTKIVFANDTVKKSDYISRKLPYELKRGKIDAYNELMSVLYEPEERKKLEWAIGAIISGDSKRIQKFIAITGEPGKGKGTFLNILASMFDGYVSMFNAKELANGNNAFAGDAFANNPLIAIQTDGDLSRIQDNTLLNSIVSHEKIIINEKFKSKYEIKLNSFLFMATNGDIAITDYNSGIKRRLIDVNPTNDTIPADRYDELMEEIENEKGAIAYHCLKLYEKMGKDAYRRYVPKKQESRTNIMYNFVETELLFDSALEESGYITAARAYKMYKDYCDDSGFKGRLPMMKFKTELAHYFDDFKEQIRIDGKRERSCYFGLKREEFNVLQFTTDDKPIEKVPKWLNLKEQASKLDEYCKDWTAQYAVQDDNRWRPQYKWENVKTSLKDLCTSKCHYIIPKEGNMVVIDFDMGSDSSERDIDKILEYAKDFPPTYAELSNGGGLHLHYIYDGDPSELAPKYDEKIEIKVYTIDKKSGIRRRLSKCNNLDIAIISSDFLPKRENKKVYNREVATNEKGIRTLIINNINKEYHPGTKPSVEFIKKILDDAYEEGVVYDVSDMKADVIDFALDSTHHSEYCLELVEEMHFKSEQDIEPEMYENNAPIVFYDVEVFPNLFLVNYKFHGKDNPVIRMVNPGPDEIRILMNYKLVGFYNRNYDNHIIYARLQGYSNLELYNLSKRLTSNDKSAKFGAAYNISYTDIYDYAAKKQSLKKWEIELGIHHQELGLPWDQPVPKKLWDKVAEYCDNDVIATEAVWDATQGDFLAREILAELTGLTVNDTTNTLSTRFIFEGNKTPQNEFNYRDMGKAEYGHNYVLEDDGITCFQDDGKPIFLGYKYECGKSSYLDVDEVGEGGYVYANPGMYGEVWTFDVASMHPSSVIAENLFGDYYTKRFADILQLRLHIKHKEFDKAKEMFDGALAKYLDDPKKAKALAQALKIVINSVYGLTAASFENAFRDLRNVDNIVAKRGALFMINLRTLVERMGYTVVHVKTDSIKVLNPDKKVIKFITDYGKRFGYNFEIEHKFEKICLVNDAVYIAKLSEDDEEWLEDTSKTRWTATGTQFAVPYVFKTLFSHEDIVFDDYCETKQVGKGDLYLDMNEDLPDVEFYEKCKETKGKVERGVKVTQKALKELEELGEITDEELDKKIAKGHNYQFVGRVGRFVPIAEGYGGGNLYRFADGKYYTATGAKGYRWQEAEKVRLLNMEEFIDTNYHQELINDAIETISQYGDFEQFAS